MLCGGWCLQSHHRFCSSARYLLREWICETRAIRKASSFEVVPSPTKPPGRIAFVCTACDACQSWEIQVPSFDKQRKFSGQPANGLSGAVWRRGCASSLQMSVGGGKCLNPRYTMRSLPHVTSRVLGFPAQPLTSLNHPIQKFKTFPNQALKGPKGKV